MKQTISILLAALLLCALAACGAGAQPKATGAPASDNSASEAPAPSQPVGGTASSAAPDDSHEPSEDTLKTGADPTDSGKTLVVVFSATGTTKGVAEKIAAITDAELYEIAAAEPYSADDLNYNDRNSRSTREQNDKSARPKIGSETLDLSEYTTIYLGFPIWWGEEPRILDTFVESYSFEGITLIPFCTSASSGIGRSGTNMEVLAGSGNWLEGKRFSGSVSEAELQSWIEGLK